jgi:hypothetical protein
MSDRTTWRLEAENERLRDEIASLRLTDAEREAVERSERWARLEGYDSDAATLRGLVARLLLTDDERDAVGMSDKPCGTCGLMVVGTNGVAMTDAKKWLTAPLPCPECSDDAGAQFRELGRQYAKKIDDAIWKALEASDERHLREAAERGRVGAGRWRTAGGSGDEIARLRLTEAERECLEWAEEIAGNCEEFGRVEVLRGLLERLGGGK